jgi:ribonucleoside-triphosphate reductase
MAEPSVQVAARVHHANGNGRIHEVTTVIKRDGSTAPYARSKIESAIFSCLMDCYRADRNPLSTLTDEQVEQENLETAALLAVQVERLLTIKPQPVSVETIQDLVEQQLMAMGYLEQAKAYILYRDERRRLREEEQKQTVSPEIQAAFAVNKQYFNGPNAPVQMFQALNKFARFDYNKGRRETWPESVERVINYTRSHVNRDFPGKVDPKAFERLQQGLLNLKASPSMRLVQMAGPALDRCQSGVYNCAFQFLRSPRIMAQQLYILMQGCGGGFSVEYQHAVDHWPRIKKQKTRAKKETFRIEDSTEAWCDSLEFGMERWLDGYDVDFDYTPIRKEGAILKTKGGRSSGPRPLQDLHAYTRSKLLSRQGDHLSSLDLHDVNCFTHRIVQMGGVRRASGISLSDLADEEMRNAKHGEFWNSNPQRNQANNSAVYDERPPALDFMDEWLSLGRSGSGERGIFNRGSLYKQLPERRRKLGRYVFGVNPCGEIILRHQEFCNLSIAVLRPTDSWDVIQEKVALATIWGTLQSTMTHFSYLDPEWKKNCDEERLLGVDLLGHMDHPLLKPNSPGLAARLQTLNALVRQVNEEWAQLLGINPSVAVTCGKPSGDSSQFFDCAAGFKPHHGEHYIRRFRAQNTDPVALMLKDQGVPCVPDYDRSGLLVLEFPVQAPAGAVLLGEMSAIEQLEHWRTYKENFTEHNPSVTIYVRGHEWLEAGTWVYENWDIVGGLSFFPFDDSVYALAPYETIDRAEYERRAGAMPEIDWAQIVRYEHEDMTVGSQTVACSGDQCSLT